MNKKVSMIGEGAWGTAVATVLAHNGYTVQLWCHDPAVVESIKRTRFNERYLPGVPLSSSIHPTSNLKEAVDGSSFIFEAIPVQYLRQVLQEVRPFISPLQPWIALSKGIEQETLFLPTQIINDVLGTECKTAALVGPSFAREVAARQLTAINFAYHDDFYRDTNHQLLLNNEYFNVKRSTDFIGVQVGSALKNVIALGIGMLDGAGYGANAQAYFFTLGLHEIARVIEACGGNRETAYGLCGVADLVLTAMSKQSKNWTVGVRIGKDQPLKDVLKETGFIPEGLNTVQSTFELAKRHALPLPLCIGMYEVLFAHRSINELMHSLMRIA
jgi:glycerol-3-phosphate dehydrogenase (NAD(P)+)